MELKFKTYAKIKKPLPEVFDAIYNPNKLTKYFTTKSASAPLDEGTTVLWDFADFPGAFPVNVKKMAKNEMIILEWESKEKYNLTVAINFSALDPESTKVEIVESGWQENQAALEESYSHCMGWSQMLYFTC